MLLAVLSDTHGRVATVAAALKIVADRKADVLVHCGDIDDASTVGLFPAGTHFVWGNCDGDRDGIEEAVADAGCTMHGAWGHLELAGRAVAFTHGDDKALLHELERSGAFDFVFYGHTHVAKEHRTGRTRVINPGALHRAIPKSFILLDAATGELERVEL